MDLSTYITSVRAFAITGIFFYHFYDFSYVWGSAGMRVSEGIVSVLFSNAGSFNGYICGISQLFLTFGNLGVDLLLTVSGFGLYLSYLRKATSWKDFFKRRVLRVLPPYWFILVVLYIFVLKEDTTLTAFTYHVFLMQTYTAYYLDFGALWFVGYIFQLYILFPLLVYVFRNRYLKWALFFAAFFITPFYLNLLRSAGFEHAGVPVTQYLAVFLFGMILAESYHYGNSLHIKLTSPVVSAASLLLLTALVFLIDYSPSLYGPLKNLFGIALFLCLVLPASVLFRSGLVRRITEALSYSSFIIFLTHVGVFVKIMETAVEKHYLGGFIDGGITYIVPGLNLIPVAIGCFFFTFFISYYMQKSYNHLLPRIRQLAALSFTKNALFI